MDNGDDINIFVAPFELFITELSFGLAENRVSTDVFRIKNNAIHQNLLQKLFSRFFTKPPNQLTCVQFSLSKIATIIGHTEYQTLLLENNRLFASLNTIPVSGIDREIHITYPKFLTKKISLHNIHLNQPWCLQVQPMQTPSCILLVMIKAHMFVGCKWIDDNLRLI